MVPDEIDRIADKEVVVHVSGRDTCYRKMQMLLDRSMQNAYSHPTTTFRIPHQNDAPVGTC